MDDFSTLRQRMVDNQIRPGAVTDHELIKAFLAVPREEFVAPAEQPFAYADRELRLPSAGGAKRTMMPPVQLARLIQALPHGPDSKVMVVGCGAGYSAAILARLVGMVVGVEEDPLLAASARTNLQSLANVAVVEARLTDGCSAEAPYDAILVDGAVELVPFALIRQLSSDGALTAVEREERASRAMLYKRIGPEAAGWPLFDAWTGLLPGFARKREFVF
jgi:protein-L-isoaspartate(D-aspartate) O-methyltransferase